MLPYAMSVESRTGSGGKAAAYSFQAWRWFAVVNSSGSWSSFSLSVCSAASVGASFSTQLVRFHASPFQLPFDQLAPAGLSSAASHQNVSRACDGNIDTFPSRIG